MRTFLMSFFALPALLLAGAAAAGDLGDKLARLAPEADPAVIKLALRARQCALAHGEAEADDRLAVIDYSRPSTERRLWVFELEPARLLYSEHVAHGRGSGDNLAQRFSNVEGSHQSSLGLFRTAETYQGGNGYSLRMDGLEPGINDRARPRAIVMHGAPYVNPEQALRQGRLGRSFGCPAVRREIAHELIDTLKQGQLLFAYYPDEAWLRHSQFLACEDASAELTAAAAGGSP
ncbi:MAG: murein L,D-transpeptidase catalytic domain family protein [Rhodanobacteraceae bacterium]|nr:murein L,D-transpeptidase catalytic domain family protein [Rhodanobacteraceae bacterium]